MVGAAGGPAAALFLSYCAFRAHVNLATAGSIDLLVVVLTALRFGFWEATGSSLVAIACLDYLFAPPIFSLHIADPQNWVALAAFELTALIVSRLSVQVQSHTRQAVLQRSNAEKLYELSRSILLLNRREPPGPQIAHLIKTNIGVDAVAIFDSAFARMDTAGTCAKEDEELARNAYLCNTNSADLELHRWQRVLRLGSNPIGGIVLSGIDLAPLMVDAIASLTSTAIERARSFDKESRAEAARQTERLRTAVLDGLAHAFKTPLTVILTCTSGLLEMETLSPAEAELVELVDQHSTQLNAAATHLLRMAKLDSAEIRLRREQVVIPQLIGEVLNECCGQLCGHSVQICVSNKDLTVSADRQLLAMTVSELIVNAAKYSVADSPITVSVEERDDQVVISVHNEGSSFHGSLFEYLQNDALDANILGFSQKAPKHFNTFGGSLGGPLSIPKLYKGKDKTFFFFDYEGNRKRTSQPEQYLVPTQMEREGNLGGGISISQINPTASILLNNCYPLPSPNVPAGLSYNYEALQPIPSNTNGIDGRIDQIVNSKQQVYARFNWKNVMSNVVNPLLPNDVDNEHDRSFLVSHNYSIRQNLLNEFRFGFTRTLLAPNFPIEGAAAIAQLGLENVDLSTHPTDGGFPSINFSAGTGFQPIGRDIVGPTLSSTKQITDNITYIKGKHTFRAGADIRWVRFEVPEIETPSDDYGLFTFTGAFTGNAFGDLLEGLPYTTYFAVTGPTDNAGGPQYGVYGQDEWRVSNRITVNAGLRWEFLPPFVDKRGIQANFDPRTNAILINSILANGLGPAPAFLQSFNACSLPNRDMALPCTNVVLNSQEGLPAGLRQNYMRNLDPRVGIAYRPFGDNKTVLRAGFGIFTVTALGQLQNNNESNPQAAVHTYQNSITNGVPLIQFPQTMSASQFVQLGGGTLEQATDPRYRDAQSAQWNVTVERELTSDTALRVSYVGMNSYRMNVTVNLNQTMPGALPYNPALASFQNWGVIYSTENYGGQNYQAMEVEATHRMSRGLNFAANYTWAHNLSDAQGDAPTGFGGETNYGLAVVNRYAISQDRGNVAGTWRQRFLLTGNYELPFGQGRRWSSSSSLANKALGGWNLNTITLLETGPYLTPTISPQYDQTNTDPQGDGAIVRPDIVGNPIPAHRSPGNYFNASAFAPTPAGAARIGNAGVGILEGPGTVAMSAGLSKVMAIREGMRMRFEATFTNVLNHTNYAPPPDLNIEDAQFGKLGPAQTAETLEIAPGNWRSGSTSSAGRRETGIARFVRGDPSPVNW